MFLRNNVLQKISERSSSMTILAKEQMSSRVQKFRERLGKESTKILTDSFGRHHTYLRISLTERCNLRCLYCMPAEGIKLTKNEKILQTDEIMRLSRLFVKQGIRKIRLTGGEPTVRKDIASIIEQLKTLENLESIGMTTNGLALTRLLPALQKAGLDALNISLDTLNKERFERFTRRRGWNRVMAAIDLAVQLQYNPVKINCVIMRGFNDDEIVDFVRLTKDRPIDVRFIEYMPFSGNNWDEVKMLSFAEMKNIIRAEFPDFRALEATPNSTSKPYGVPGFVGQVGFITSMSEHFCYSCNRLRITADGNLKVCLFEGKSEVSLRDAMRNGSSDEDLEEIISLAVSRKKKQHAGVRPSLSSSSLSSHCHPKVCTIFGHGHLIKKGSRLESSVREYSSLSHIDGEGKAKMVDVGGKATSNRCAQAQGWIKVGPIVSKLIAENNMKKGDVMLVAKVAGIMAAKKCSDLIPLCHPLALNHADVNLELDKVQNIIRITSEVRCCGKTGVEMEALTAVSVAALTVYDMCKSAASPDQLVIGEIRLIYKSGGKGGVYMKQDDL